MLLVTSARTQHRLTQLFRLLALCLSLSELQPQKYPTTLGCHTVDIYSGPLRCALFKQISSEGPQTCPLSAQFSEARISSLSLTSSHPSNQIGHKSCSFCTFILSRITHFQLKYKTQSQLQPPRFIVIPHTGHLSIFFHSLAIHLKLYMKQFFWNVIIT